MTFKAPTPAEIEEAVQARNVDYLEAVLPQIVVDSTSGEFDWDSLTRVSDAWRRIGRPEEGLRTLVHFNQLPPDKAKSKVHGSARLMVVRLLNALGASTWALRIADDLHPEQARDREQLGLVYLSNSDAPKAYRLLLADQAERWDAPTHGGLMKELALADALALDERWDEAVALAVRVEEARMSPLLALIARQARSEYSLASAVGPAQTLVALNQMQEVFREAPVADRSMDRAFILKWIGYGSAKLGRTEAAEYWFSECLSRLREQKARYECWAEVQRLRRSLGALATAEWSSVVAYPGYSVAFARRLLQTDGAFPESGFLHIALSPCGPGEVTRIDLIRDEMSSGGKASIGVPSVPRLIAWILRAGQEGIPRTRLISGLWPDEVGGFFNLKGRLQQLLVRARRDLGVEFQVSPGLLRSAPHEISLARHSSRWEICFSPDPTYKKPCSWLEGRESFSTQDLIQHFGGSRTQAKALAKEWLVKGWVLAEGAGRASRYQVVRPVNIK